MSTLPHSDQPSKKTKTPELKVYGGLLFIGGNQYRHFLAAPTFAAAVRILDKTLTYGGRKTLSNMRGIFHETHNPDEKQAALASPGVVFRFDLPGYSPNRKIVVANFLLAGQSAPDQSRQKKQTDPSNPYIIIEKAPSILENKMEQEQTLPQRLLVALTHAVEIAEGKREGRWDDLLAYRSLIDEGLKNESPVPGSARHFKP